MRSHRLWIILLLLQALQTYSQQLPLQTFSPANGLCDARLLNMHQDSLGRLYFLTREGFSMHDGQRITNFTWLNNAPIGHTNYMITLGRGELLVSALSGLYILRNGVLTTDSARFGTIAEPGRIIGAGGKHLLITGNGGLYYYDGCRTRRLNTTMIAPPGVQLNVGQVFLYGRLLLFNRWANDDNTRVWYLYDIDRELMVKRFTMSGLQTVAFGGPELIACYQNRWQQLDSAALQKGEIKFTEMWFNRLLPPYQPGDGVQVTSQYIWQYRRGLGFLRINLRNGRKEAFKFEQGILTGVFGVFDDREGNAWFMTNGQGVQKLLQPGIEPFNPAAGSPAQPVTYAGQSAAGEPCFVTGGRLYCQRFNGALSAASLPAGFKQGPVFYWNNQYWNLQPEGKLQGSKGGSIMVNRDGNTPVMLAGKIQFDAQNRLLLCGTHLQVLTPDGEKFSTSLPYFTDNICVDEAGLYWCFTRGGQAAAYQLSSKGLRQVFSAATGLSARATIHWNKDSFLIGTRNNGLYWAAAGQNSLRLVANITTAGGLSNNFITALAIRAPGEILAGTATGMDIIRFSAADTSVERMLSRINVFQSVSSITAEPQGRAWVYSNDQLLYLLPPPQPQQRRLPPAFFFSGITVNGNPADAGGGTRFSYNRNNFRFAVSAPSFMDEKNIRFRFMLKGSRFNKEQQGEKADFEITNLPAGNYTLTATAVFPGNHYQPQTIYYRFHIKKPFWKTTGFILGAVLTLLALIYAIFRSVLNRRLLRQRMQLEKEQAVSHERTRIATDMHDDLGAGLSAIKFLSQGAPYIAPDVQQANNLKISRYADELVDKMNDIIWAMNEKNDTLDNLIFYCKAWVTEYCDEHQLICRITLPATIPVLALRGQLRQNIFLCIKEAVHNIVKHAAATQVDMIMMADGGKLRIKLADNGRGFDHGRVKGGNGLYNMQKRMAQVNGRMQITGGNGATVVFEIPLP